MTRRGAVAAGDREWGRGIVVAEICFKKNNQLVLRWQAAAAPKKWPTRPLAAPPNSPAAILASRNPHSVVVTPLMDWMDACNKKQ